MWLADVFLDTWVDSIRKVQSICRGVLDRALNSWVSVSSFNGIRFKIRISSGRISWLMARSSSITKIFSDSKMAFAGRSFCILIGMFFPLQEFQEIFLRKDRYPQLSCFFIFRRCGIHISSDQVSGVGSHGTSGFPALGLDQGL